MSLQEKADKIIFETKVMRQLQVDYFINRNRDVLNKCKSQEHKVDRLIKEYTNPFVINQDGQTNIFDHEM